MFGLEFLFSAALFALPLAALPLILHLLYRRKSPVVQFPTLEFVKASLQQSAARRKVQRWLLLAVRMLLLALLIWAVAQPARTLASRFFASEVSSAAVVVVDTSWSMQYRQDQVTLAETAEGIVQQMLREQLRDASILMVTSDGGETGRFRTASEWLSTWRPLVASVDRTPLADRVNAAAALLEKHPASEKVLVVISDFQSREFPRPLANLGTEAVRVVALDLRPGQARSAGVQGLTLSTAQPVAGLPLFAEVEVAGPAGDARPVQLTVESLEGETLVSRPAMMANFDQYGQARVRFELAAAGERWQVIRAQLTGEDPMAWDDARGLAVELPPKQRVAVVDGGEAAAEARRLVKLALDPTSGAMANWPLVVEAAAASRDHQVAVAVLESVPELQQVTRLRDLARGGGTVILLMKPGIEAAWPDSAAARMLEELLPSPPYAGEGEGMYAFLAAAAARQEPAMAALENDPRGLQDLRAMRIVPMQVSDARSTRMLVGAARGDRRAATDREGLLYVRRVGAGRVYTMAVVPEGMNTNLGTHPMFLPLMVSMALRPAEVSLAQNVVSGEPLSLRLRGETQLELHTPGGESFQVAASEGRFTFADTRTPGIYRWMKPGESEPRGISLVSLPGDESQTVYRAAQTLIPAGQNVLVARSLEEMESRVAEVSRPQPRWSIPLALVLILLCMETVISTTRWPSWLGGRKG